MTELDQAPIDRAWASVHVAVRTLNADAPQDEACVFCDGALVVTGIQASGPYTSWYVQCPCRTSDTVLKGL